jgi:hypothetical protein
MSTLLIVFDPAQARPLDAHTRRDMELRFRADFAHVRIHTGPLAAAAARALGAQAFTVGHDIFFAADRFAPDTPHGRGLLAHELAHVLQQGPEPWRGFFSVGSLDDPQERRAAQLAHEALTSTRITRVVRERGRVARRAVLVNDGSAKIDLDFVGALPNTFINTDQLPGPSGGLEQIPFVTVHLTRNFSPVQTDNVGAWTATGRVGVSVGALDGPELAQWNFGFIQFMEIKALNAFYAGRVPSDGGILIAAHQRPALSHTFGRDAAGAIETNPPWTTTDTTGDKTLKRNLVAESRTEDHPQLRVRAQFLNRVTAYKNFLFRLMDIRKFVVIFSARDPAGNFRHLAHFELNLSYDFDVIWKPVVGDRIPIARRRPEAAITPGIVHLGAPNDPAVRPFLNDPTTAQRLGTTELSGALRAAATGSPPNRNDEKSRIGSPPSDFFL